MFQEKVIKKEKAGSSESRQNGKNKYYRMEPSVSQDVRVVQRVELSAEQADRMFQGIIRNINYHEIAIYCIANYIKYDQYLTVFRNLLFEKMDKKVVSFSHGEEIAANSQMLYEKLEDYMDENWERIQQTIQTEVNALRFAPTVAESEEEGEAIFTVIYHTDALKAFCEADPQIMGTIDNLRHHYHGTPQTLKIDGESVLHQHVTGGTALAFRKNGEDTIEIMAYGIKSDSAIIGTGGYHWDTKPK